MLNSPSVEAPILDSPLLCACWPYIEEAIDFHSLDDINILCKYCSVYHWISERVLGSSLINSQFQECCKQGTIHLLYNVPVPSLLYNLFTQHHPGYLLLFSSKLKVKYEAFFEERLLLQHCFCVYITWCEY